MRDGSIEIDGQKFTPIAITERRTVVPGDTEVEANFSLNVSVDGKPQYLFSEATEVVVILAAVVRP